MTTILAAGEPVLSPTGWLAVGCAVALFVAWKLFAAWFWPWTDCRRCSGGKFRDAAGLGRNWAFCRKCGGSGRQLRHTYRWVWQRDKADLPDPR